MPIMGEWEMLVMGMDQPCGLDSTHNPSDVSLSRDLSLPRDIN